ncbi:PQQ-binding-like beta-propeller repeat protein [Thermodesulfobacteriota bacterium]
MDKNVYIGIKGKVVAYDKYTGEKLWQTPLKGSQFVSICVDDDIIIAHTGGFLYCISKSDGSPRWVNKMPGLGYGLASISTMGPGVSEGMVKRIVQQRQAAGAGGAAAAGS